MPLSFPTNTGAIIDEMRDVIGRAVIFFSESRVECYNCTVDPVTDTSTNSFCPVCSGVGYEITYSGVTISGHVTHAPSEVKQWSPGGVYTDGDCRVQVKLTAENETIIDSATYVTVDDKNYTVKRKIKRGVPELNRILVDLIEK